MVSPKNDKAARQLKSAVKLASKKALHGLHDEAAHEKALKESSFLARLSISRPMFVTCLVLIIILMGLLSMSKIGVDLFPEIEIPVAVVIVPYRGAGPAEIETQIVKPLEEELSTLAGIKHINSVSGDGFGRIMCQFYNDTDMKYAEQQVRNRVQGARGRLPKEIDEPIVQRISLSDQPVVEFALPLNAGGEDLYETAKEDLKPLFEQVPGVGKVELLGGSKREIQVQLDRGELKARALSATLVTNRIMENSSNVPVGKTTKQGKDTAFRTLGEYRSLSQIAEAVVSFYDRPVRVKDVAQIVDAHEDASSLADLNGKPTLIFKVYKQSGMNTVKVVDAVLAQMDRINLTLAKKEGKPQFELVRDAALWIRQNLDDVKETIAIGILLVIAVVYFFLGNFRSTFITSLALPNSLLGAFILMKAANFTINLMTLLALSLSVGLLIDDAIVVRENIFRMIEKGMKPVEAALRGTKEVSLAVIATSSVVIAVFLPVGFLTGTVGKFLSQFGLTMCFAMAISLFDALTIAPMLSAYFAGKADDEAHHGGLSLGGALVGLVCTGIVGAVIAGSHGALGGALLGAAFGAFAPSWVEPFERFQQRLEARYERTLRWVLIHRGKTLLVGVAVLVLSFFAAGQVTNTFIPNSDSTEFQVTLELKPGTSLEECAKVAGQVEELIRQHKEVAVVSTTVGGDASAAEANKARLYVGLQPHGRVLTSQELKTIIRAELTPFAFANPHVGDVDVTGGQQAPVQLILKSENLDELTQISRVLQKRLEKEVPGMVELDSSVRDGKPEFQVKLDPAKAGRLGVSTVGAGMELRNLVDGAVAGKLRESGREYDIRVRLKPSQRDLELGYPDTWVPNLNYTLVKLSNVSNSQQGEGPSMINRFDRTRSVEIDAQLAQGAGLGNVVEGTKQVLEDMKLPPDVSYAFVGQIEDFADMGKSMGLAMLLAVVLMYLVLVSLYESFITPFTIFLALPFAIAGAFFAFFIVEFLSRHGVFAALNRAHLFHVRQLDASLNLFSNIGLILLLGLVAKNSILLVDYTQQLVKQGLSREEALVKAGLTRLRPILMTSLALFFGTLPLALALNEAGRFRSSMGVGIAGGLVTSTLLTLIIVPAAFEYIDDFRIWFEGLFKKLGSHS